MTLPIDCRLDAIRDALETHPRALLVAEPGAGKTTRVANGYCDCPDRVGGGLGPLLFPEPLEADPLASNWGAIDQTIAISFWVTGLVFVAVTLFMALALFRYPESNFINLSHKILHWPSCCHFPHDYIMTSSFHRVVYHGD